MILPFLLAFPAHADPTGALPAEARANDALPEGPSADELQPRSAPGDGGLRFLGLYSARATLTDVVTTNPLVTGQVVGELGGTNSTTTGEETGAFTEQRLAAFFRYSPPVLDAAAELDAAFEIDFAFGDQSYSVGGNTGGAFGADQVNLQTRRLGGRFRLAEGHTLVAGLQFVGDGVNDPATSRLDELVRSGGRLMVFGSEAAGVTAYGRLGTTTTEWLRYRAGAYTLYEEAFGSGDDVSLLVADLQAAPAYATRVGLHGWLLRDRGGGAAGILGSGVSSSLSEMQGGPRLDFRSSEDEVAPEVDADLAWLGLDAGHNAALNRGPFGVHAVLVADVGRIYVADHGDLDVRGALVDVEGRWRYAAGEGSLARVEALYTTPDEDGDGTYTGMLTANSWGIVGALYSTHGCYLLFPDAGAIDRAVSVVPDVSGGGAGIVAVTASVGYDAIPDRLGLTLGAGHARTGGGDTLGTEFSGRLSARPFVLGNLSLVGAGVVDSALPSPPWTMLLTFDWWIFG